MWSQYDQEIHPIELHELSLEELTGTRPSHKGTLMYLKQKGIPEDAIQFRNPGPEKGHLRKLVKAIEHDFYTGPVVRHPEVEPLIGTGLRLRAREIGGPPQRPGYSFGTPMSSRELMTGRREGRAAALFQRMKDRSDQYVVDESTVPGQYQYDPYGQEFMEQEHRPWQKSPWEVAADHPLGLPDRAFEQPIPKPKPKSKLQNPAPVQKRGPPVYTQVDSIRQRQSTPQQTNKPAQQFSCSWKGETTSTRFHSGVRPYETNHNRTARGWSRSLQKGQGLGNDYADVDDWGTGRGGRGYDKRPKSWVQGDEYSQPQGRPRGDVARSRQVVGNVIGPKSWGGESDDL